MATRKDAGVTLAQILMKRIDDDRYPSWTEMGILESALQGLPPEMTVEYLRILLRKVARENRPSITMLRHIQQLSSA